MWWSKMYTPFSVQHPNNFTTFGCGSSPIYFMICSSWIRSRFSDSDALAFNIFTATVVGPEIKWTIEYSWVWHEENKITNLIFEHFIYIKNEKFVTFIAINVVCLKLPHLTETSFSKQTLTSSALAQFVSWEFPFWVFFQNLLIDLIKIRRVRVL